MKLDLDLHIVNHGIPIGQTITKTAIHPRYGWSGRNEDRKTYEYRATFERVNGKTLRIKVGDIVKLTNFSFKEEVRDEFGVIIDRYRIIKNKINGTFKDYYAVVLMSTGKMKGELYHVSCHRLSSLVHQI